jgi:putative DNA methylase
VGKPKDTEVAKNGTKLSRGANFKCLISGMPISGGYIKVEGKAGRMGARLMAIVVEGDHGRIYLPPIDEMEAIARQARPEWKPEQDLIGKSGDQLPLYGVYQYCQAFTARQLVALTTFSDMIQEVRELVHCDALAAGLPNGGKPLAIGATGPSAYSDAVGVYLGFAVDKACEGSTTLCTWNSLPSKLHVVSTFGRQALQMTWDYAEANLFADSSGNILRMCELVANVLDRQCLIPVVPGLSRQLDAAKLQNLVHTVISTDPPYYLRQLNQSASTAPYRSIRPAWVAMPAISPTKLLPISPD